MSKVGYITRGFGYSNFKRWLNLSKCHCYILSLLKLSSFADSDSILLKQILTYLYYFEASLFLLPNMYVEVHSPFI